MITEKHCCRDCKHNSVIPDIKNKWELICLKNHKELNKTGGLTDCTYFEEKNVA